MSLEDAKMLSLVGCKSTPTFDQFALFRKLSESNPREDISNLEVKSILEGYEFATLTREIKMSAEEKSQRLNYIIIHQPIQNMIGRPNHYRKRKQLGYEPPRVVLFDGCHRLSVIKEFIAGKCYVKIFNKEDGCYYHLWATQEAVDAVTENKEYHAKIESELLHRLMECRVSMTLLDRDCSDQYAYERALMANQCKTMKPDKDDQ